MAANSIAGSFFSQPLRINTTTQKASNAQEVKEFNAEQSVKLKDELPKPLRTLTPEEQEQLKKDLAGKAAAEFDSILKQDALRKAEQLEANGNPPSGVLVNIQA